MLEQKNYPFLRHVAEKYVDRWLAELAVPVPPHSDAKTHTLDAWISYRDWIEAECAANTDPIYRVEARRAKCQAVFLAVMRSRFQGIFTPYPYFGGLLLLDQ